MQLFHVPPTNTTQKSCKKEHYSQMKIIINWVLFMQNIILCCKKCLSLLSVYPQVFNTWQITVYEWIEESVIVMS